MTPTANTPEVPDVAYGDRVRIRYGGGAIDAGNGQPVRDGFVMEVLHAWATQTPGVLALDGVEVSVHGPHLPGSPTRRVEITGPPGGQWEPWRAITGYGEIWARVRVDGMRGRYDAIIDLRGEQHWLMPLFPADQVRRIAAAAGFAARRGWLPDKVSYPRGARFAAPVMLVSQHIDADGRVRPRDGGGPSWQGRTLPVHPDQRGLYAIGAGAWPWDLADPDVKTVLAGGGDR